ncbi:MAG: nuclear transport factor 2 family protein [Ignavibacteriales bacterium]|nr:nuclear transport factor 2 family protein [Ignavibacteriales bacterium]
MKLISVLALVLVLGCQEEDRLMDRQNVEMTIRNLQISLKNAYTTGDVDTDRLIDEYYDSSAYYVTPWGTSEVLDSTKSRLRTSLPRITDYDYSIESMDVKTYGDAATAFFVLRQDYKVDGKDRSEYLPTTMVLERRKDGWKIVHIHRSADPESWKQWFGN